LAQVVRILRAWPEECFFWATHAGAKLDLLVVSQGQRLGFEFKRTDAPRMIHSMHSAIESLHLDRLTVVHAGKRTFPLTDLVQAVSIHSILTGLTPVR